jgi:hypothetical protein
VIGRIAPFDPPPRLGAAVSLARFAKGIPVFAPDAPKPLLNALSREVPAGESGRDFGVAAAPRNEKKAPG